MKKVGFSLIVLIFIFFFAGCASGTESASIVGQEPPQDLPTASPTTPLPSPTPSPYPSPSATAVPSATPAPSPTPTPPPSNLTSDNFTTWAQVNSYAMSIEDALGLDLFDTVMDAFAYSPDGSLIAVAGCTHNHTGRCNSDMFVADSFLYILDAQTEQVIAQLPVQQKDLGSVAFTADSRRLLYTQSPAQVVLWDIASAQVVEVLFSQPASTSAPLMTISPDGSMIALVFDSQLVVLDAASGDRLADLPAVRWTRSLPQFSADGSRLAVFGAAYGTQVAVYDTASWQRIAWITLPGTQTNTVALSPDGRLLLAASLQVEGDILLWDVDSGERLETLHADFFTIHDFVFTPDSAFLLMVGMSSGESYYNGISVWDLPNRRLLGYMHPITFPSRLEFSADGTSFIANDYILPSLYRWSLPDADLLAVQQTLLDFLAALNQGDYDLAAGYFRPNAEELAFLETQGLPTADFPALFESLCLQPQQPCMAVNQIKFSGTDFLGGYTLLVDLLAPDGSIYLDSYGESLFWLTVELDQDGIPFISMLPYFLYQ